MADLLLDSLVQLLRYQRAPEAATGQFRNLKHNAHILPALQIQLEAVSKAHGKFREVIYDIQGIRDDGADIIVRIPATEGEENDRLLGFQAKSFGDMSKPTHMQDLKAQRDDAFRKIIGLEYYFIFLCTDMAKHKDRVRSVMAEFKSADRTEVIEPAFAFTFLHHPITRIDAFVKRSLEAGDMVFRDALEEVRGFAGPSSQALVILLAVNSILSGKSLFHIEELLGEKALRDIYDELREKQKATLALDAEELEALDFDSDEENDPDGENEPDRDFEEGEMSEEDSDDWEDSEEPQMPIAEFQDQLTIDLELIDSLATSEPKGSEGIQFLGTELRALTAVITDAIARYGYNKSELVNYMYDVMGIRD